MEIIVEAREDMLKSIEKRLSLVEGADAKDILRKGVNKTAKQARTDLARQAAKSYIGGKVGQYKGTLKNATKSRPTAVITYKGEMREIQDFKASPIRISQGNDRPKQTKGKVLKKTKMTPLIKGKLKAFTVKFKSDHIAVVERNPNKMMDSDPKKQALDKLLSPSIPHAIKSSNVYGVVEPSMHKNLEDNMTTFISGTLGGVHW